MVSRSPRLRGDNAAALIDISFSGLTAPQTGVNVRVASPEDGPIVRSLPPGQVTNVQWELRAAQFLANDQDVLDALLAGSLYANVETSGFTTGEIRGSFRQQSGSTLFEIPPDPPPIATLTGEALDRDLVRFLTQASFGPTTADLDVLRQDVQDNGGDRIAGMSAWIDRQLNPTMTPASSLLDYTLASAQLYDGNSRDRRGGWWLFAIYGPDQLRQRMAFALSQIFVTSDSNAKVNQMYLGAADYYDMLIDGAFGSYRDLLLDVSLHPIMGQFLSSLRNQKQLFDDEGQVISSPDENYAREIMQLLSFGLVERHPTGPCD